MAPHWLPWRSWPDFDRSMPVEVHRTLLAALGVTEKELPNANRGVCHGALPITRRVDYCPLCFIEDLHSRRTPYFRYQWTVPVYTCCARHGTPLMMWRCVRGGDERVLPLRWALHPRLNLGADCPWLDEDTKRAGVFDPSRISRQSPLGLVGRLSAALVRFQNGRPGFEFTGDYVLRNAVDELVALGASTTSAGPLVNSLRPVGNPSIFGKPARTYEREFFESSKCWRSSVVSVAYRRSLLWFAARTLLGSGEPQMLTSGRTVPPCAGDRWLDQFVRPAAGQLGKRLLSIESRVLAARQWASAAGI